MTKQALVGALPPSAVGIACSGYVSQFLDRHEESVDYVEVPFELLRHDPRVVELRQRKPIVLHCASLSIGGTADCPESTIKQISRWICETSTPWLGEHLAFVTANPDGHGRQVEPYARGQPYDIGYTVSPPMNEITLERVVCNVERYSARLGLPLLLENSPLYFNVPTSSMSQVEYIRRICQRTNVGLLLDLAHFYISSQTMGYDPLKEIDYLPLERVVEVHISGVYRQAAEVWDDHARSAPPQVYALLARVCRRVPVRAVTLEYNWSRRFPETLLLEEIARTREVLAHGVGYGT